MATLYYADSVRSKDSGTMSTKTKNGRALKPHDHVSEVFVCRDCGQEIDPVGGNYPGYTREDCDSGKCPLCGGTDTAWLFAEIIT